MGDGCGDHARVLLGDFASSPSIRRFVVEPDGLARPTRWTRRALSRIDHRSRDPLIRRRQYYRVDSAHSDLAPQNISRPHRPSATALGGFHYSGRGRPAYGGGDLPRTHFARVARRAPASARDRWGSALRAMRCTMRSGISRPRSRSKSPGSIAHLRPAKRILFRGGSSSAARPWSWSAPRGSIALHPRRDRSLQPAMTTCPHYHRHPSPFRR
jgi:hypothetical protein